MNIEDFIPINKDEAEINQMSPLVWAYVGDCVYELYIRTYLVDNTNLNPHKLHIEAIISILEYIATPNVAAKKQNAETIIEVEVLDNVSFIASNLFFFLRSSRYLVDISIA